MTTSRPTSRRRRITATLATIVVALFFALIVQNKQHSKQAETQQIIHAATGPSPTFKEERQKEANPSQISPTSPNPSPEEFFLIASGLVTFTDLHEKTLTLEQAQQLAEIGYRHRLKINAALAEHSHIIKFEKEQIILETKIPDKESDELRNSFYREIQNTLGAKTASLLLNSKQSDRVDLFDQKMDHWGKLPTTYNITFPEHISSNFIEIIQETDAGHYTERLLSRGDFYSIYGSLITGITPQ